MTQLDMSREQFRIPDISHVTQVATGRACGVSGAAVGKWRCPRNVDGSYSLPAVIAWRIEEAERRCVEHAGGDPDLVGPDSPNLERLRAAKADLAEDQRDLGRSNLYDAAEVRMALSRAAAHLRKAGERLERRYGPDAQRYINDAMANWTRELKKLLAEPVKAGAGGTNGGRLA